mmetsp:Transcript_49795/g.139358  ORF Transcript_49795/g.139358 Transcript_49795/m.139358 type:complete len:238 (-) Transcript_49795:2168-2881(-)
MWPRSPPMRCKRPAGPQRTWRRRPQTLQRTQRSRLGCRQPKSGRQLRTPWRPPEVRSQMRRDLPVKQRPMRRWLRMLLRLGSPRRAPRLQRRQGVQLRTSRKRSLTRPLKQFSREAVRLRKPGRPWQLPQGLQVSRRSSVHDLQATRPFQRPRRRDILVSSGGSLWTRPKWPGARLKSSQRWQATQLRRRRLRTRCRPLMWRRRWRAQSGRREARHRMSRSRLAGRPARPPSRRAFL